MHAIHGCWWPWDAGSAGRLGRQAAAAGLPSQLESCASLLRLQEFAAYRHEDRLVISTGSATGAYSALSGDGRRPNPSFALMDVDGGKVGRQGLGMSASGCRPCCGRAHRTVARLLVAGCNCSQRLLVAFAHPTCMRH